ncbi:unnamed protein product [Leptidea sinapis]|uniref:Uncharacterized protein n=1 Tax=Leptidea sinapis TaxID=189913 RepID=A0A5E4QG15_9NEOP|nr:unnamed protein product [Leptidea sinapis]
MDSSYAKTLNDSVVSSSEDNIGFIDDYSHLRLSYYQNREDPFDLSVNSSFKSCISHDSVDTVGNDTNKDRTERKKLLDYYVSQMPDFPHPSATVASIIATSSNKMNDGMRFKYDERVQTSMCKNHEDTLPFSPNRRSTLIPKKK